MNFLIYEQWDHYIPTGKNWAAGLIQNNQRVFQVSPREGKLSILFNNLEPNDVIDYIVHFDVPRDLSYAEELDKIKQKLPNVKIIGIVLDYGSEFEKFKPYIDYIISLTYKHKSAQMTFTEAGYKYYNIPLAVDHELFKPTNYAKIHDVGFIGQFGKRGHGYRREDEYLFPILEDSTITNPYFSGFNYKETKYYEDTAYEKLPIVYNQTKVNLNFHYDHQKTNDRIDFNGRTFEICAAGGFQLCDHPNIKELVPSMIVEPDGKLWKEKVHYYLEHEEERNEIAKKCYDEVITVNTWKFRMSQLLNILENK